MAAMRDGGHLDKQALRHTFPSQL